MVELEEAPEHPDGVFVEDRVVVATGWLCRRRHRPVGLDLLLPVEVRAAKQGAAIMRFPRTPDR